MEATDPGSYPTLLVAHDAALSGDSRLWQRTPEEIGRQVNQGEALVGRRSTTAVLCVVCLSVGWAFHYIVTEWDRAVTEDGYQVPRAFAFVYEDEDAYELEEARRRFPVDSIILERWIFAPLDNYVVVLSKDDWSRYSVRSMDPGRSFAARRGTYRGEIDFLPFATLALQAYRMGFMQTEQADRPPEIDGSGVRITLVVGGRRVSRRATREESPEFWLLAEAIDGMVQKILWTETDAGAQ